MGITGKAGIILPVAAAFFLLWGRPVLGLEKGVLVADNLFYDFEAEQVTARGNASLTYKDMIIRSTELLIDVKQNILQAGGTVEIEQENRVFSGRELYMNFRKEQGSLEDYYSFSRLENGEPLVMQGERAEVDGDVTIGYESSFTGCDREKSHYHITARKVEYYPDDKIVFRHVVYWEGGCRLFYLPVLVVSLRDDESNFERPVVGYNEYDGWYVKLVYRYFTAAGYYGLLMVDWLQHGGFGEGVKQYFPLGAGKDLYFNLYHLNNYRTGGHDIQAGAGWSHKLGPLYDYSLDAEYWQKSRRQVETYEYDEYRMRAAVTGRDRTWPFSLNLEAGKRCETPEYYFLPRLQLRWRPSPQHSLEYSGRLEHRERPESPPYPSIDTKYSYNFKTSHNLAGYRLRTEISEAVDQSPTPLPNWYSLNKLPSVSLVTPVYRLGAAGDYRLNLDYLRLVKVPENKDGYRTDLHLQRVFRTIWQKRGFTLQIGSSLRRQDYWLDEGEFSRSAWSIDLKGTQRFTTHLFWENTASWVEAEGSAPSAYFPHLVSNSSYYLPRGNIQTRLYYSAPQFRAEIRGGYNLGGIMNPWHLTTAGANWELNEQNRLDFNTSYNPNTSQFGVVRLLFRYEPDRTRYLHLNMVYDPQTENWSTLDLETRFRQELAWNFQADFNLKYSFFGDGLEKARVGLVYDWHCRELMLGYDALRREYYLQIWYKVFPEAGFGFGSSQAGFTWPGTGWEN